MLKYFTDPDLKFETPILNLGKLKAGSTKQFTYYIYNDNVYEIEEMAFSVLDVVTNKNIETIKILEVPTEMKEKAKSKIVFEWNPLISIKPGKKAKIETTYFDIVEGV